MSFFEFGVFGPASPEVLEGFLLVPECLLQDHAGYVSQKWELFLERHKPFFYLRVGYGFPVFVVGISAKTEGIVINKTTTAERLSKECFLFWRWVESFLALFGFQTVELPFVEKVANGRVIHEYRTNFRSHQQ